MTNGLNVIMRLGRMHSLMSFVGSIGTLMAENGLAEVMSAVFGGVTGKTEGTQHKLEMSINPLDQ